MPDMVAKLRGGHRRSIGQSDEVARDISEDRKLFSAVFRAMLDPDRVVRMRAADAIEKASRKHPELLQPYKRRILGKVALADEQEVRWHVAQILPRLRLTSKERDWAVSILFDYLEDKSSIVRTFAMQALADLALQDRRMRARVVPMIEFLTGTRSEERRVGKECRL